MDSYVVRIYRRNASEPEKAVGEVEIVDTREKLAFTDFRELQEIMSLHQALGVEQRERTE